MIDKTKDYLRLLFSSVLLLAMISLLMACGGGGAPGVASDGSPGTGNTIFGRMALSRASTASSLARTLTAATTTTSTTTTPGKAYTSATVQLVDSAGNVVYVTTTDKNGKFEFNNVVEGDYTMVVIDVNTGNAVTQVNVSVLNGDDVNLEGVIDTTKTQWTIQFTSNDNKSEPADKTPAQHVKELAQASGVSIDKVIDMRLSGMSWVEIAKELGVDPGVLGLDNGKAFETDQTTDTTNTTTGTANTTTGATNNSVGSTSHGSDDQGESNDQSGSSDHQGESNDQSEHANSSGSTNNGGSTDNGGSVNNGGSTNNGGHSDTGDSEQEDD